MAQPLPVHDDLSDFAAAVRTGLAQPQKVIPARFFYDHAGSELFEAITDLPEYYPTRTEITILTDNAPAIAAAVGGQQRVGRRGCKRVALQCDQHSQALGKGRRDERRTRAPFRPSSDARSTAGVHHRLVEHDVAELDGCIGESDQLRQRRAAG